MALSLHVIDEKAASAKPHFGLLTAVQNATFLKAVLIAALVLGAGLRLWGLGHNPPGLNQDEASNAWNAWCLLKTGKDQAGVSWPIFCSRCTGSYNTTLYLYLLIPFEAVGGLNVITARLPSIFCGVGSIALLAYVAWKLFDKRIAVLAAILLALNPWHMHLTRLGTEGVIAPLLALVPVAMLYWAGFFARQDDLIEPGTPRPIRALLAGLLIGVCCYAYWAIRLFIPVFLLLLAVLNWHWFVGHLKKSKPASALFLAGLLLTVAPLAYAHFADPNMNTRGRTELMWHQPDHAEVAVLNIALRYLVHFDPVYLFTGGEVPDVLHVGFRSALFHFYSLPFMAVGIIWLFLNRKSAAAKILLAGVLAYPVGDSLGVTDDWAPNVVRSMSGIPWLVLLEACGLYCLLHWAGKALRQRTLQYATAVLILLMLLVNVHFLYTLYYQYPGSPYVYKAYMQDLREAAEFVREEAADADQVFITSRGAGNLLEYLPLLVHLQYDPQQWLEGPKEFYMSTEFLVYWKVGKYHFNLVPQVWERVKAAQKAKTGQRIVFILRPTEYKNMRQELLLSGPLHVVHDPISGDVLVVCEANY